MITLARSATRALAVLPIVLAAGLLVASTAFGATRTWVSGVGDDVNPCSRTAPCKTLAGAISKTSEGGEINALDGGGFGAVSIVKSITIDLRGVQGSVLNASTTGIVINAGANDDVTIRNLSIDSGSPDPVPAPPACPYTSTSTGIRVFGAGTVRLQGVDIVNQGIAGIKVDTSATAPIITAQDVNVHNVCGPAIQATSTNPNATTTMLLDGVSLTHALAGIRTSGNMDTRVTRSTIADTDLGLDVTAPAVVHSLGENVFSLNGADGAFTTGTAGFDPVVNPTPVTVTPTPVTVTPTPVTVQSVVQTVRELVIALADSEFEGVAGKPVKLRYGATGTGEATLTVRSGKTVVAEVEAATARGRNIVTWNGKAKGKAAPAGSYRVTLEVIGADGQRDVDAAVVVLARASKATPGSAAAKPAKPAKPSAVRH